MVPKWKIQFLVTFVPENEYRHNLVHKEFSLENMNNGHQERKVAT